MNSPEEILTTRFGFHKSMMTQPSDLMWHAVYQAMEAYAKEVNEDLVNKCKELGLQMRDQKIMEEEISTLKAWKADAIRINLPLITFMQDRTDIPVGDSVTATAIKFIKERDELVAKRRVLLDVVRDQKKQKDDLKAIINEMLIALEDSQACIDFGTNAYRINEKLIAKAKLIKL